MELSDAAKRKIEEAKNGSGEETTSSTPESTLSPDVLGMIAQAKQSRPKKGSSTASDDVTDIDYDKIKRGRQEYENYKERKSGKVPISIDEQKTFMDVMDSSDKPNLADDATLGAHIAKAIWYYGYYSGGTNADTSLPNYGISQVTSEKLENPEKALEIGKLSKEDRNTFYSMFVDSQTNAIDWATEQIANTESQQAEKVQEWAKENPILGNIASLAPLQAAGSDYLNVLTDAYAGTEFYNPNDINNPSAFMETARAGAKEGSLFGTSAVGQFFDDVVYSSIQSEWSNLLSGGKAAGPFSSLPLALYSASSTARQMLLEGHSREEAAMSATTHGVISFITEAIGSDWLIDKAYKNTRLGEPMKAFVKRVGSMMLRGFLGEGSEEIIESLSNLLVDNILDYVYDMDTNEFSKLKAEELAKGKSESQAAASAAWRYVLQLGLEGLAGGLSGGLMAGGSMVAGQIAQDVGNTKAASKFKSDASRINLIENLKTVANSSGGTYADNLTTGGKGLKRLVENIKIGSAMSQANRDTLVSGIEERLLELGVPVETARSTAEAAFRSASEGTTTKAEDKLLATSQAQTVLQELEDGADWIGKVNYVNNVRYVPNDTDYSKIEGANDIPGDIETTDTTPTTTETAPASTEVSEKIAEYKKNAGIETEVDEVNDNDVLSSAAKAHGIDTTRVMESFQNRQNVMSAEAYANAIETAKAYGEAGLTLSEMVYRNGFATDNLLNDVYTKASENFKTRLKEDSARRVKSTAKFRYMTSEEAAKEGVTPVNMTTKFTAEQEAQMKVQQDVLAKAFNVNIAVFDGAGTNKNGWYDSKTNTLFVDINSMNGDRVYDMLGTTAHELVHSFRTSAPGTYIKLRQFIAEEVYGGENHFSDAVEQKMQQYKNAGHQLESKTEAVEEIMADSCAKVFDDGTLVRKLAQKDRGLFSQIKSWLADTLAKIKSFFTGKESNKYAEKLNVRQLERAMELFEEAAQEIAQMPGSPELETITNAGLAFDEKTQSVMSLKYSTGEINLADIDREDLIKSIMTITGRTHAEVDGYIKAEEMASAMVKGTVLDFEGNDKEVAIKKNSDYPQGTIDLTNICVKRLLITQFTNRLQEALPDDLFTADDYADIRLILMGEGKIVACGLCFVEDRRKFLGEIASDFMKEWNNAIANGTDLMRSNSKGERKNVSIGKDLAKRYGVSQGKINPSKFEMHQEMFTSSDQWFKLQKDHPEIAAAFEAYNNARGQNAGRLLLDRAEYKREILNYSDADVKAANDVGGLRIFSFSDFETIHLLDLLQIIEDCAAKGVKIQGYTKQPNFAKLVRNTGLKLNRSLIPYGATGLQTVNGKRVLVFDTVEGMNPNSKDFIDESKNPNVGNNITGINDEQIHVAMLDNFISYIIPFHTNKSKEANEKLGVARWENYRDYQTDHQAKSLADIKKTFKLVHQYKSEGMSDTEAYKKALSVTKAKFGAIAEDAMVNIYTDVLSDSSVTNERTFLEKYLRVCEERNIVPRYAQFLDTDADGNFVYTEGYTKFLVDFKLFDYETGEILPQQLVTPNFDEEFIKQLINEELQKSDKERNGGDYSEDLYESVLNYIKVKHGYNGNKAEYNRLKGVISETAQKSNRDENGTPGAMVSPSSNKLSLKDTEGKTLTKDQQEFFKDSQVRDEQGRLIQLYHGTKKAGFTTFSESDDIGYFFTDKLNVAGTYSKNWSDTFAPKIAESWEDVSNLANEMGVEFERLDDGLYLVDGGRYDENEYKDAYDSILEWNNSESNNYKVYLNLTDPLIINGNGSNWDEVIDYYSGGEFVTYEELTDEQKQEFLDNGYEEYDLRPFGAHFSLPIFDVSNYEINYPMSTREWVQEADDRGCDGVIFQNIVDLGGNEIGYGVESNVYVALNSNQIKSVNNTHPTEDDDIRLSLKDTEYLELAKDPTKNETKLRKMVEQAAKKAGYQTLLYHGTHAKFNSFDISKSAFGLFGYGFYFDSKRVAEQYGEGNVIEAYVKSDKIANQYSQTITPEQFQNAISALELDPEKTYKFYVDTIPEYLKRRDDHQIAYDLERWASEMKRFGSEKSKDKNAGEILTILRNTLGKDGLQFGGTTVIWDNKLIKSADPVTYDDNGNVIPLSERFKSDNEDLRYSLKDSYAPTFYSHMSNVIGDIKQDKVGAASVVNYLKGKGVKDEEIKWSGIETFLEGKKSVTKQELQEFAAGSMLQIEEKTLSQYPNSTAKRYAQEHKALEQKLDDRVNRFNDEYVSKAEKWLKSAIPNNKNGVTDLTSYWHTERNVNYYNYYDRLVKQVQLILLNRRYNPDPQLAPKWMNSDLVKELKQMGEEAKSEWEEMRSIEDTLRPMDTSNWSRYKTDGGDNYQELLFKMPNSTHSNKAMSVHWGERSPRSNETGVLAHARVQDIETTDGKMLFIEEIQSDWHNAGQKEGYQSTGLKSDVSKLTIKKMGVNSIVNMPTWGIYDEYGIYLGSLTRPTEADAVRDFQPYFDEERKRAIENLTPDAPFKTTYTDYVLKRLLRIAAENGYSSIGWTTAKIQDERWDDNLPHKDGEGNSGNLKGYTIEYDQDMPKFLNKYGKKWGGKVDQTTLSSGDTVWRFTIPESMKQSVLYEGQPMYSLKDTSEPLKTLNGSIIKRSSKYGVGKQMGDQVYVHKNYASEIVPANVWESANKLLPSNFDYNCIMYNPKKPNEVRFDQAPDFDTAREPKPGKMLKVDVSAKTVTEAKGNGNMIWHHKWQWVKDDYKGFDVGESYNWSKTWLQKITNPSGSLRVWNEALQNNGLPIDSTDNKSYSLKAVAPVNPTSNVWARGADTQTAMQIYPNLWNVAADTSEKRNPTQITTTVSTYRKIYGILKSEGFDGKILDASSGRGYGTKAGIEEFGFKVDDIEPYPGNDYSPKYEDYSTLNNKYDVIISNAVLNVLPQDQRDALVVKMGELLNNGGRMFINVRSLSEIQALQKAVDKKTGKPKNVTISASEVAETTHGSYQKGFTKAELKAYLEDALGDGYTVAPTDKFGGTSVIVTKNSDGNKYSLKDSDGKTLSQGQQEFFKDSKVRDDQGRLLKVYHGTHEGGFTVFYTPAWFSNSERYADGFEDWMPGKHQTYKVYLNIKNPYVVNASGAEWSSIEIDGEEVETDDIVRMVKDNYPEYDGVIIRNVDEGRLVDDYIPFYPNQIKLTTNLNPTENEDIRYSIKDIESAWSRDTSYGNYSEDNPSAGQCAVTALYLNQTYGYKLYDVMVGRTRHFFNKDASGNVVDLTAQQFKGKTIPYESARERNPKDLLTNTSFMQRYNTFKSRVDGGNEGSRYSIKDPNELENAAKKLIGSTDKFEETGYVLSDGTKLKFTNKKHPGERHLDHRYIAVAYGKTVNLGYDRTGFEPQNTPYLEDFVERVGAIRVNSGEFALGMAMYMQLSSTKPITKSQESFIRDFIEFRDKREREFDPKSVWWSHDEPLELIVEFGIGNNATTGAKSIRYTGDISASAVIADINRFYKTGEVRSQSNLSQFRYSYKEDLNAREYLASAVLDNIRDEDDKATLKDYIETYNEQKETFATIDELKAALESGTVNAEEVQEQINELRAKVRERESKLNSVLTNPRMLSVIKQQRETIEEFKWELQAEADKVLAEQMANGREKATLERRILAERVKSNKKLNDLKAKMNDRLAAELLRKQIEIANIRAKNQESRGVAFYRPRVEKAIKDLTGLMPNMPVPFRNTFGRFLQELDLNHYKNDEIKIPLSNYKIMYAIDSLNTTDLDAETWMTQYGIDINPELTNWIDEIREALETEPMRVGFTTIAEAKSDELKALYKILRSLNTTAKMLTRAYTNKALDMTALAKESQAYIGTLGEYEQGNKVKEGVYKFFDWSMAQPATVFDRAGDGGRKIFKLLQKGQSKAAFNDQVIADFIDGKWTKAEARRWSTDVVNIKLTNGSVSMTPAQMMTFYCTAKDKDGYRHLVEGGGFKLAELHKDTGKKTVDTARRINDLDVASIEAALASYDPRLIKLSNEIQQFIEKVGSQWGNQVSIQRFGIEQFGIENYFPLHTVAADKEGNITEQQDGERSFYGMLNRSFTKERKFKANNAVVIDNIFDVFADHMSKMSVYNAFALPVLDTARWMNYSVTTRDAKNKPVLTTLGDSMNKAFGRGVMQGYIRNLLTGLNGTHMSEETSWALTTLRLHNRVAVAANIRVAVQQPFSIVRAYDELPMKYFTPVKDMKGTYAELIEHSGIGLWKDQGHYDVNIKGSLLTDMKGEGNAYGDFVDEVSEKSMVLAELGDKFTWTIIWNACKNYVNQTNPGLTGDDFYNAVDEKFSDIIYRTQVVDTPLQKSDWMRKKDDFLHRMTSSFKAEPTTTYNMLLRAYDKFQYAKRQGDFKSAWAIAKGPITKAVGVFAAQAIVNALVTAIVDAMRDDDDYETLLEKLLSSFGDNLLDNINPFASLPWVADAIEILKGYSPDRVDLSAITNAVNIFKKVASAIKNDSWSYSTTFSLIDAASKLSGIPVANAMRDVVSVWNSTVGAVRSEFKVQQTPEKASSGYEALYKAVANGNTNRANEIVDEIASNKIDPEKAYTGTRNKIKEAYRAGKISEDEAVEYIMIIDGYFDIGRTRSSVEKLVSGW